MRKQLDNNVARMLRACGIVLNRLSCFRYNFFRRKHSWIIIGCADILDFVDDATLTCPIVSWVDDCRIFSIISVPVLDGRVERCIFINNLSQGCQALYCALDHFLRRLSILRLDSLIILFCS